MRRSSALVFFILAALSFSVAQNSLPVKFLQVPSRSTSIGMFRAEGITYGSVSDLARTLNMKVSEDIEVGKIELRTDQYTIKVTAGNPFIVIIDKRLNANIVQLPSNVISASGHLFAPVEYFVPILDDVLLEEITYDKTRAVISVGGKIPVSAGFDIAGLTFEQKSNGYLLRFDCSRDLTDYESWLKPAGDDTWLYITIADARADVARINRIKPSGFLKKILVFQSPTSVQFTFKIKGPVNSTEVIPAEGSHDILVTVHTPSAQQTAAKKEREHQRSLDKERSRWKMDAVVIDAGHGGDDPGTIGVARTKEKDVTLAIARKLGQLMKRELPDVRVIQTRETDDFVELYRRGQIANQAEGKLFISIHCNSTPRKPSNASGFEIYLLRPGKTDAALAIAERENSVVRLEEGYERRYQKLTEENFILLTMAQSAYVKYSEQFAEILQAEMAKQLHGANVGIRNNGVKQAGFLVLVGASMPNVLVETGYLSNRNDEKFLKSAAGQQKIAQAILNGVKRYKEMYEKSLLEGGEVGSN